jgi:hypothetical protein
VLFSLHRELEPIGSTWNESRWKAVVACWLATSNTNNASLPGFDSVWATFKRRRTIPIKKRFGDMLERVHARRILATVPSELAGTRFEAVARTMIALSEEHSREGRRTFFASLREIAKLSGGIDPHTAESHLASLSNKGYASLVEPGTPGIKRGGKANTWQWHTPPIPGEAVWMSNKKTAESKPMPSADRQTCRTDDPFYFTDDGPVSPPTTPTTEGNASRPEDDDWSFLATNDDDTNESFHELAAKMEFDGGLTQADAEEKARLSLKMDAR